MRAPGPEAARQSGVVGNFFGILPDERFRHNAGADLGTPVTVTYSMLQTDELPRKNVLPYAVSSIDPLTGGESAGVAAALAEYAATAGVRFVKVADGAGQLQFATVTGSDYGGWSYYPLGDDRVQPVVLDRSIGPIAAGTHGYEIALHEIGHAVGLKHPHEGEPRLLPRLDDQAHTIMTYNYDDAGHGLGIFDKQAVQYLYGAASTGTPRIVFSGGALYAKGSGHDDVLGMSAYAMTARLNGGNDTAFAGAEGGSLDGSMGNDSLYGGRGSDRLIGGSGDDMLVAESGGRDTLEGGRDDDRLVGTTRVVLDGGSGNDTLELASGTMVGGEGGDWLLGGVSVRGSGDGGDDVLKCGSEASLDGGDGNDRVSAGKFSVMTGGDGDDRVTALAVGNDHANAGWGGPLRYVLDGGAGSDTLLGLAWSEIDGGDGDDSIVGVESTLSGGAGDDTIRSSGLSEIDGGAGDDLIYLGEMTDYVHLRRNGGHDIVVGLNYDAIFGIDSLGIDVVALRESFETVGRDLVLDLGGGDVTVFRGAGGIDPLDLRFI